MSNVSPNPDEINALRKTAPPGPIVMLNLLKFRADGGREAYARYMEACGPAFEGLAVEVVYAGLGGKDFAAGQDWDMVVLIRYPSFETFADALTHPHYVKHAIPHREKALEKAVLMVTQPTDFG